MIAALGITIDKLKKMDGHDGKKAYVSVEGKVYDVSELSFWRNGSHQGDLHLAGNDITKEILTDSPHGLAILDRAYLVGLLVFTREQLARFNEMAENKRYVAYDGTVFDVSDLELWELDSGMELSGEEDDTEIERLQQAIKIGYLVNN
ncbi:cytochrome b5 domain-containing protein [Mesotoga sp. UBA6090]|uniref:cytochrome b5 domain-containing protein n=1 Tax=Mesotoga sp. UBA6090 TaxID=1946860 RepID=UPI0025ECF05A|nr:cytochrome b5 domain-containing protein [Mesotoga sp. UBA6090]